MLSVRRFALFWELRRRLRPPGLRPPPPGPLIERRRAPTPPGPLFGGRSKPVACRQQRPLLPVCSMDSTHSMFFFCRNYFRLWFSDFYDDGIFCMMWWWFEGNFCWISCVWMDLCESFCCMGWFFVFDVLMIIGFLMMIILKNMISFIFGFGLFICQLFLCMFWNELIKFSDTKLKLLL